MTILDDDPTHESQFTEQDLELRLSSSPVPRNGGSSSSVQEISTIQPSSSPPSSPPPDSRKLKVLVLSSPPSTPLRSSPSQLLTSPPLQSSSGELLSGSQHPVFLNGISKNGSSTRGPRVRRTPNQCPEQKKNDTPDATENPNPNEGITITPPFPWATEFRATIRSREYLESNGILKIRGDVFCKDCHKQYEIDYDFIEKFNRVGSFIAKNKDCMFDRAPEMWLNPNPLRCENCGKSSVKPIIPEKNEINWLFLLLGEMLGFCTLEQLKYFCKHTNNHRTGAKDRLLYTTYLTLCRQLDPNGPFNR